MTDKKDPLLIRIFLIATFVYCIGVIIFFFVALFIHLITGWNP